MRYILLTVVMTMTVFFGKIAMAQDDLFGISFPTNNEENLDVLKNLDWKVVEKKIKAGEIDDQVILAMTTRKIPNYFKGKIEREFIVLYREYLINFYASAMGTSVTTEQFLQKIYNDVELANKNNQND